MTATKDHAVPISLTTEGLIPLNTSAEIFAGDFVIVVPGASLADTGADTASAVCVGVATRYAKQSSTPAPDATHAYVPVATSGIVRVKASGLASTDVGKLAYIYQNDTVKVSGVTNYVCAGKIVKYISATECDLDLSQKGTLVVAGALPGGTVTASMLASDSVITAKILNLNVTTGKIAADAIDGTKIADDAVSLEHLDAAITPSHIPVFAGKITWSGSGASLATTVTGVLSTDIVIASIEVVPTQAAYLKSAAPTTDTITLVLSAANTGNDAVVSYVVYRAAA